jgi:hypothetical protein
MNDPEHEHDVLGIDQVQHDPVVADPETQRPRSGTAPRSHQTSLPAFHSLSRPLAIALAGIMANALSLRVRVEVAGDTASHEVSETAGRIRPLSCGELWICRIRFLRDLQTKSAKFRSRRSTSRGRHA